MMPSGPLRMGTRICKSVFKSMSILLLTPVAMRRCKCNWASSGVSKGTKWKFGPSMGDGVMPWLMRAALSAISLPPLCLKMCCRRTLGMRGHWSKSLSTFPGPTLGSWSASPTKTMRAVSGTASRSEEASQVSTILNSSTMSKLQSSLLNSFLLNLRVTGSTSSRRWMV